MTNLGALVVAIIVLACLMAPVQFIAFLRMRHDLANTSQETGQRHGTALSSSLSLVVFTLCAFVPAVLQYGNPMEFTSVPPLRMLYDFLGILLKAPKDNADLAFGLVWIKTAITFGVPALAYSALNTKVTAMIWRRME